MGEDNPCKRMTSQLRQRNRIQKTSFLKKSDQIAKDMKFPESRETTEPIPKNSPNTNWQLPKISKELSQKADKSTPTNIYGTPLESFSWEGIIILSEGFKLRLR